MRHFVGFLSGLIVGPVLVLMTGWAFAHLRGLYAADMGVLQGSGPLAVAGLVGVGLLVALSAVPARLTPMLPLAMALTLGALSAVSLVRMHLLERLPQVPGTEGALVLLPLGVFVPLVVVLFTPVFVGGRWRRERESEGPTEEEYFEGLYGDDEGPTQAAPQPAARHRA
ncbi:MULTISPECIES: hypothetical protein [Nocardiopsis]|uniref:Uncharacterized protein n=1 Tax=Nocardiopsis sinuspersici TaxID=501010 RepID=A0A1V3C012_9ACTN|nr:MULTISPECIES: hypothetical protein [Nocardiopsis]OOC53819.1 hypothetical protein NOSIN_08400 [Nocardiopsis sinuspersici]